MNNDEFKIRIAVAEALKNMELTEIIEIIQDLHKNLKIMNDCKMVLENHINEKT